MRLQTAGEPALELKLKRVIAGTGSVSRDKDLGKIGIWIAKQFEPEQAAAHCADV